MWQILPGLTDPNMNFQSLRFVDSSYQTGYAISSLASISQSPLLAFIFILCSKKLDSLSARSG